MAIVYEKEGHVCTMTMSNPDRMNALTVQDWLDMEAPIFKTHDAMEGPMAFLEKRKPNFKGK